MNFLLTKENITFLFSVIGFFGTATGWIYYWITTRKKIDITIFDYSSPFGSIAQFFVHFQNQSHSPICIVSIDLVHSSKKICCELIPKKIRGTERDMLKTPMFPINLYGKQGYLCFLEFVNCEHIQLAPGNTVVFLINTNRGQVRKSVILSKTSRYLHID